MRGEFRGTVREMMQGTRTERGTVEKHRAFVPFMQLAEEADQSQEDYAMEQRLRIRKQVQLRTRIGSYTDGSFAVVSTVKGGDEAMFRTLLG